MNEPVAMTKKQYWAILIVIALVAIIWAFFRPAANPSEDAAQDYQERTFPIMGTVAQIKFYGRPDLIEKAEDLTRDVFLMVENTCSTFNPKSELSQLNQTAYEKPFKCSDLLWAVLQKSREAYQLSNGAFDVTIRPLMSLWGFYRKRSELPPQVEIDETLKIVGMDKVIFNDQDRTVQFKVKGLALDLGGIAKGYAVDMAVENVKKLGINAGVINLAGNMYCFPTPPPKRDFYTIGIRNPFNRNKICGVVRLHNASLSTSGNYERYVTFNGHNYTHIVNPKTGQPIEDMLSVTVISPSAVDADLLSTSVFVGGVKLAEQLYATHPDLQFLIMRRNAEKPDGFEIIKIGNAWESINPTGK